MSQVSYDKTTGKFTWIARAKGRTVGTEAGAKASDGYISLCIDGVRYPAHWVAWLFVKAEWPHEIDHRNAKKGDNRITNLRRAERWQNAHNKPLMVNNTSGHKGIRFKKNRWEASCMVRKKRKYLGRFLTLAEAKKAYRDFATARVGEFFNEATKPELRT